MALTIETATVGHDSAGVSQLLEDIRAKVIEEAINKMNTSLETLNSTLDDIWVGHSATLFKENMQTDVTKITDALNKAYDALKNEINQIVKEMGHVDQELVKSRS